MCQQNDNDKSGYRTDRCAKPGTLLFLQQLLKSIMMSLIMSNEQWSALGANDTSTARFELGASKCVKKVEGLGFKDVRVEAPCLATLAP